MIITAQRTTKKKKEKERKRKRYREKEENRRETSKSYSGKTAMRATDVKRNSEI